VSFDDEYRRLTSIRDHLIRRSLVFQNTRSFFTDRGFLEVETPVRVPTVAPEQYIVPYASDGWFLATSPELWMKRLLASGYPRLFQISRCFRKGELGRTHNPEFTMLEWYRINSHYQEMMSDTQQLVSEIARDLGFGRHIPYLDTQIDLALPWEEITVREAFLKSAGWDPISSPNDERFDVDLVSKVIPGFPKDRPVILKGYPASMASLARLNENDPRIAERAEVFVGGLEIANAYSELNDPEEQVRRFEKEITLINQVGGKASLPQKFIDCLASLPACGGIALGMDRLVMLFCNTASIHEVLAFSAETV
jgi:elongation factor P--(R)-beta-lysine ligase